MNSFWKPGPGPTVVASEAEAVGSIRVLLLGNSGAFFFESSRARYHIELD